MKPILASTLLEQERTENSAREFDPTARISSSCAAIDALLDGGFSRGRGGVCCLSGPAGSGRRLICLHVLVTHLLNYPSAIAYLLDTNGAFDVLQLKKLLITRLKESGLHTTTTNVEEQENKKGRQTQKDGEEERTENTDPSARKGKLRDGDDGRKVPKSVWPVPSDTLEHVLKKTLVRIKLIRVLDLIGLDESVDEIEEVFGKLNNKKREETETGGGPEVGEKTIVDANRSDRLDGRRRGRKEVADSEDEDENDAEDQSEEDEMLFEPAKRPTSTSDSKLNDNDRGHSATSGDVVIIYNIAHLFNALALENYVKAQAKMSTFFRRLGRLTKEQRLCTMVLSAALPVQQYGKSAYIVDPANSISDEVMHLALDEEHEPQKQTTTTSSSSTTITAPNLTSSKPLPISYWYKPALGKTFPYLIDLHLFVSSLAGVRSGSKSIEALRRMSRDKSVPIEKRQHMGVIEVLSDRYGSRAGRWTAFGIEDGVKLCGRL